mgnify:CR=1 FL=1
MTLINIRNLGIVLGKGSDGDLELPEAAGKASGNVVV